MKALNIYGYETSAIPPSKEKDIISAAKYFCGQASHSLIPLNAKINEMRQRLVKQSEEKQANLDNLHGVQTALTDISDGKARFSPKKDGADYVIDLNNAGYALTIST